MEPLLQDEHATDQIVLDHALALPQWYYQVKIHVDTV